MYRIRALILAIYYYQTHNVREQIAKFPATLSSALVVVVQLLAPVPDFVHMPAVSSPCTVCLLFVGRALPPDGYHIGKVHRGLVVPMRHRQSALGFTSHMGQVAPALSRLCMPPIVVPVVECMGIHACHRANEYKISPMKMLSTLPVNVCNLKPLPITPFDIQLLLEKPSKFVLQHLFHLRDRDDKDSSSGIDSTFAQKRV